MCSIYAVWYKFSQGEFVFLYIKPLQHRSVAGDLPVYLNCKLGAAQLLFLDH